MDVCLDIYMEKLRHRGCRNASQSMRPKITKQHRENTTENDGNYVKRQLQHNDHLPLHLYQR